MKHGSPIFTLTRLVSGFTIFLCVLVSPQLSAEIYKWTDENGVTHFTETPPPSNQEAEIQEMPEIPALSDDLDANPPANENQDGLAAQTVELSAADLKRQELAQARAENEKKRAAVESLCQNIEKRLAQIEPSRRVFYTNAEGETVRMDDEQRVAEVARLKEIQSSTCQ